MSYSVEVDGKTYTVGLITEKVLRDFERGLFERSKVVAKELSDIMTPEHYREHLHDLGEDFIGGKYSLYSERGQAAMKGGSGGPLIFSLMMNMTEIEFIRLISSSEAAEKIMPLIQQSLKESFPDLMNKLDEQKKTKHDPRRQRAVRALLADRFGLRPWEIDDLTPRQIQEIYFHPRDRDGEILFPEEHQEPADEVPETLEGELQALDALKGLIGERKLAQAKEKIRVKYADRHQQ